MIPDALLLEYGGRIETYVTGDTVFQQNQIARNFFQITRGQIKVSSISDEGKEFIQGIFKSGESFGEPPLFADITYPATAFVLQDSEVLVVSRKNFLQLLSVYPRYYLVLLKRLSLRLHYKATIVKAISNEQAESRVLILIDYLKKKDAVEECEKYEVPLTRQQIADLIGLRVETVIRAVGSLKDKNLVQIKGGKIIR